MDKDKVNNLYKEKINDLVGEVPKTDENEKKFELQWFLVRASAFLNYNPKTKELKSEIGEVLKKKMVDEKGNPVLDEKGKQKFQHIQKTWVEVEVPYSKGSEYIRIPNQRVKKIKSGFLYNIGINVALDNYKVYTPLGKEVTTSKEQLLKAFRNNHSYIEKQLDEFHHSQDKNKELEKEKEK